MALTNMPWFISTKKTLVCLITEITQVKNTTDTRHDGRRMRFGERRMQGKYSEFWHSNNNKKKGAQRMKAAQRPF